MNIIIAGAGKVGCAVARELSAEGHDLTLIEADRGRLDAVLNDIDAMGCRGNAADITVLEEARAASADIFIAATSSDEVNLVSCQFAKRLGARHTMARIRSPEYTARIDAMREIVGLSLALNPDLVAAEEISRVLQFPSAARIETFPDCEFEIVTFRLGGSNRLRGASLTELERKFGSRVLVCAVERGTDIVIPRGDFVLAEGDAVTVTGTPRELRRFFTAAGSYKKPVRNVMILGGSPTAVYLTRILENSGVDVTIIEKDEKRCRYLAELLRDADVVCANGTDTSALREAGLEQSDGFVALSNYDQDNIILSLYAAKAGVEKVIPKVNDRRLTELMGEDFADGVIAPKERMAQKLVGYVRALSSPEAESTMEALYYLCGGRVAATEFVAGPGARCAGRPLRELKLRPGVLLACVLHNGRGVIPDGSTVIHPGDKAVVITTNRAIRALDEILAPEGGVHP